LNWVPLFALLFSSSVDALLLLWYPSTPFFFYAKRLRAVALPLRAFAEGKGKGTQGQRQASPKE
jgi:hypothetical protein